MSLSLCSIYEDVIYLKDGSVIYGTIIEQKPGDYYKVKSGKSSMIIKADEVEMIKREEVVTHGCLDSKACNYNPNASIDKGSFGTFNQYERIKYNTITTALINWHNRF